jgi:hypothetical protein
MARLRREGWQSAQSAVQKGRTYNCFMLQRTRGAQMKFLLLCVVTSLAFLSSGLADTTLGTPIGKVPFIINKPGKYRLIKNLKLKGPVSSAIDILAPNVVLDLNGFTIGRDDNATFSATAILVSRAFTMLESECSRQIES